MPKPEPTQLLPRILSAALVAGCVWLLLQNILNAPSIQNVLAQPQMAGYLAALNSGDPAKARALFDHDIRSAPADPGIYVTVEQACAKAGRWDLAVEYLDRGVIACKSAPAPQRAFLYQLLSDCYRHTEKTKPQRMAIQAARNALNIDPESPATLNAYGYILAENGEQIDEAVLKLGHALELLGKAPDSPESQQLSPMVEDSYGWALYKRGRYDAAVSALDQAIADFPGDLAVDPATRGEALGELYYHLGAACRKQKNAERAKAALRTALSYAPNNKEAKAELEALKRETDAAAAKPSPGAGTSATARGPAAKDGTDASATPTTSSKPSTTRSDAKTGPAGANPIETETNPTAKRADAAIPGGNP